MAYIDKCFYFDDGEREVNSSHPDGYDVSYWDTATVRWRQSEIDSDEKLVSIELWQRTMNNECRDVSPLYGEKVEDAEVCLTRENALRLAQKLIRAVQELDTEIQMEGVVRDIDDIKSYLGKQWDKYQDRKWESRRYNPSEKKSAVLDLEIDGGKVIAIIEKTRFDDKDKWWVENKDLCICVWADTREKAIDRFIKKIREIRNRLEPLSESELTPAMWDYREKILEIWEKHEND